MKPKNNYSHFTAKERDKLSFPMNWLKRNNLLKGKILDFGCGFGTDADILNKSGFDVNKYDKFYFKKFPKEKFETITCIYVLNVVDVWEQSEILMSISNLLEPNGKAYLVVRRDIKKEGYRTHFVHKKPTYQTNVVLPFKSILKNDFTEIYEYQHFQNRKDIIFETALSYSYLDNGEAHVKTKRDANNFIDLSITEQISCFLIANRVNRELNIPIWILSDFQFRK